MTVLVCLNALNQQSSALGGSPDLAAGTIDAAIAVGSQWLLFNLLPRSIRKSIRTRKASK
jgi:hypothetical protein